MPNNLFLIALQVTAWIKFQCKSGITYRANAHHSGVAGSATADSSFAEVKEGTTIITASTENQYATEENGSGVFTALFVDALEGAAANLVGDVTPGSIYAHIDQSLGAWEQRPVFKANVKKFVSLREVQPPISLPELRRIDELFPPPGLEHPLDADRKNKPRVA